MSLYKSFSKYVIETFLTDDKKFEYVSLIIDEQFIENAATKIKVTPKELIESLRADLYSEYPKVVSDINFVLATISLQLYAASICEKDGECSANAYNPRLCEILNCNTAYLQSWYRNNQTSIWMAFYKWCRSQNFQVRECLPRNYKNKYVQYPLELAKYLLNREDLKYIASQFKGCGLEPDEDIYYSDFWKVLNVKRDFRELNNHIKKVFDAAYIDTNKYDIVKSQIYNYYLVWDGEYIDPDEQRIQKVKFKEFYNLHLSDKDDNYRIDIRKDDDSRIDCFKIDLKLIQKLKDYYSFKREGLIIFQKCSYGDLNYWDETRFIEKKDSMGIAMVFDNSQRTRFYNAKILFQIQNIVLYKFKYGELTSNFYSDDEKSYMLLDGLKVSRNTYLIGGDPIWRINKDCEYLINGKTHSITKGDHILDLAEGDYVVKFPKSREVKIKIIAPREKTVGWTDKQSYWEINRKDSIWKPSVVDVGIIGLNFACYLKTTKTQLSLLNWVRLHQGGTIKSTSNITLKLLNNINKYE